MADPYQNALAAERAKHPEIQGNWPESVELNGEVFAVLYGFDGAGEIESFVLADGQTELLFPSEIAVVYLTEEHIWEIISWEFGERYPNRTLSEREQQLYGEILAEHNRLMGSRSDG